MSTGGAAGGAVAVVVAAKRKHICNLFRIAGAVTISNAKTLEEIHVPDSHMLRRLVRRGEIVKVDAERYYLDETEVSAGRKKRIMLMVSATLIVVIIMLIVQYYNP